MYKQIVLLLVLTSASASTLHAAGIYKCIDKEGKTVFSQYQCAPRAKAISVRPEFREKSDPGVAGLRKGEIRILKRIKRDEKTRAKKRKQELKQAGAEASARKKHCTIAEKRLRKLQGQRREGCAGKKCERIDEKIRYYRGQRSEYCY